MQRLEVAAVGDELSGEKIEELGMSGFGAHESEVARRGDNASAEMMLPHAVRQHAPGERILRRGDPVREGAASQRGLRVRALIRKTQ